MSGGSAQPSSAYSFSNYSKGGNNGQHNSFAGMNNNTYDYHNSVSGYGGSQGTAQRNSQHQPTVVTSMVVTNSNVAVTLPS